MPGIRYSSSRRHVSAATVSIYIYTAKLTRGCPPQIIALQACHYLVLALITPPLLFMFADPLSLSLEGGSSNVAMVMDWREMVGTSTIEEKLGDYTRLPSSLGRQKAGWGNKPNINGGNLVDHGKSTAGGAAADSDLVLDEKEVSQLLHDPEQHQANYAAADPVRGWIVGGSWVAASSVE